MPLPVAAAAASKGLKAANAAKDLLGGGKKKNNNTGKKIILGCGGCGLGLSVLPLLFVFLLLASIAGGVQSADAAQNAMSSYPPMPDICSTVTSPSGNPAQYMEIINGVATALGIDGGSVTSANCPSFIKNNQAILLLSMAWADSQWGTVTSTTLPSAGGGGQGELAAAQAAAQAGFSGQSLVIAIAIAGAETGWKNEAGGAQCTPGNSWYDTPQGMWQICDSPQYNFPQLQTDPVYNAQAAFTKSNGGTSWCAWETYSGVGCSSGSYNNSYAQYLQSAAQYAQQAAGTSLGSSYEGIVLMSKQAWQSAGIANPNDATNAAAIFAFVVKTLNTDANGATWPASDPSTLLTAFYSTDQTQPNTSTISNHVSLVEEVMSIGGSGVSSVLQIANMAADQVWHITNFCTQGVNGQPWSNCDEWWCADFATWVYWKSGAQIPDIPGVASLYAWGQSHNLLTNTPKPGELALWGPGTGTHVSIVTQVNPDGSFMTVNGDFGSGGPPQNTVQRQLISGGGGGYYLPGDGALWSFMSFP
ncbi:MAG: CHAP domain-containing protein [Candidatus Dormibacteria bacterium]